jgi:hypothetical protein
MPLLARQQQKQKADAIAHANAPQQLSEPRHGRPYLLKMLQDGLGTRVLADTLDWDGELCVLCALTRSRAAAPWHVPVPWGFVRKNLKFLFLFPFHHYPIIMIALAHYNLDASVLSLDNVYKGIQNDMETYYFLWVAVRKVLAEAPNVMLDLFKVLIVPVGKYELTATHDILKKVQWR